MSTAKMAELLEKTEKWDPVTPQVIQSLFKNDSRAMESLGKRWNIAQLEQDARYNQQNPEEGIANASKATGLGFLGAGIGNLLNSGSAYGAAVPGVNSGSQQAAMLAQQTGEFGKYGLGKTMEAASTAQGLPWYQANLANNLGGMMSGSKSAAGNRFALQQGLSMMQPQPMQAPSPPQRYQPPPPPPSPYGMTEEEKERLRMMGYQVY